MSYCVDLPVFSGPLDLLLHLIKQQEVDIHEIAIANILDQYLAHLEVLQSIDLADIGEFVVMASTLMEIKSRELLPGEEISLDEELDPKDDLIRRLLEYKRFRDASRRFDRMASRRARMMGAGLATPKELRQPGDDEPELDLDNVEIWALTAAFAKLLEETGGDNKLHMEVDRRNMRFYTDRVLRRVLGHGEVLFETLFDAGENRYGLIGVFVAVLELMKQGLLAARQENPVGPIAVRYLGPAHLTVEQVWSLQDESDDEDDDESESESEGEDTPGETGETAELAEEPAP